MEATCSSETSVSFRRTARRYFPEERTLQAASFLCVGSVQSDYNIGEFRGWQFRVLSSRQLAVRDSHAKSAVKEELEVSL
jgi:hypothetical protein